MDGYKDLVTLFCSEYYGKLTNYNRRWYVFTDGRWIKDPTRQQTDAIFRDWMRDHGLPRRKLAKFQWDCKQVLKYTHNVTGVGNG